MLAALRHGDGAGTSHCRAAWPGCFLCRLPPSSRKHMGPRCNAHPFKRVVLPNVSSEGPGLFGRPGAVPPEVGCDMPGCDMPISSIGLAAVMRRLSTARSVRS
jgi:hypothetical protein